MNKRTAFTLIELLIVVAIIAILAAIAVPNFLEAQTRAKVSRAKADMRSMATGVESYAVDWNNPPIGTNLLSTAGCVVVDYGSVPSIADLNQWALSKLTTPIAYLTSLPQDPFTTSGFFNLKTGVNAYSPYYTYSGYNCAYLIGKNKNYAAASSMGYVWTLYSPGPSRNIAGTVVKILIGVYSQVPGQVTSDYDPTNGTVSWGFIIRSNKGQFRGSGS